MIDDAPDNLARPAVTMLTASTRIVRRIALAATLLYACWLAMLATHEAGHVLHAWVSGGRVIDVALPPLGFSQTIVHPNPRELLVVWGGPAWGVAIPLIVCGVLLACRRRVPDMLRFFAGFCLIANGAYVGVGWIWRSGDAGEMLRLGTPPWVMVLFGTACVVTGLWLWHRTRWMRIGS
jgi:hypothetical protein